MKIESSNNSLAVTPTAAPRAVSNVEAQSAVGGVQKASSTVNLTSMSTVRAARSSDIDTAKVEAIKASLRDGSYKIDSGKIADGVISDARDLMTAKAR